MGSDEIKLQQLFYYIAIPLCVLFLLYAGRSLFIPMFYGLLIALVLYPFCRGLEARGFNKTVAIIIGMIIVTLLILGLGSLLILQVKALQHDLPELKARFLANIPEIQAWIYSASGISQEAQNKWWSDFKSSPSLFTGSNIRNTMAATFHSIYIGYITPVFTVLFLYNRKVFVQFLSFLAGDQYKDKLSVILRETVMTYAQFIKGMIKVYLIVGTLNSIGLLLLGIKHALLFGYLTAIMTIIPYIGIFVSSMLPISVAWLTKGHILYPIGVIAVFSFVQYLEGNIIFPRVVGSQLNISTWATLVGVIVGGILWGISGMILFIPFIGMLKIVSDYIPEWKALNILISRSPQTEPAGKT